MFRAGLIVAFSLLVAGAAAAQNAQPNDVDITAADGVKLRGTYFAAGKPGPAVLLFHMCNTTRKSWEPVARELSEKGINALTIDNRGFGESGGPTLQGAAPEVQRETRGKWPSDFDAAYQFLLSQPNVDRSHIGAGGGSCGVDNAVKLAERHPDVKSLVLLAGPTDVAGYNFISQKTEMPVFTAGAADDQFNPDTIQLMKWTSEISANPRSKFEGFPNGRHGTEIFGPHPELVHDIVAFFGATLGAQSGAEARTTPAREFWRLANQPGGGALAAAKFHEARQRDPQSNLFPEFPLNLLGYDRLQAGHKEDAIELFKLNAEAYPTSANTQDSLSDGYLTVGKRDLALSAEEKCLALIPNDKANADFLAQLRKVAEDKIAKLKSGQ